MFRTAHLSRPIHRPQRRWGRARLWLQSLEERATPAMLTVTSALDDGVGNTLRNVMAIADSNGEADTIQFAPGITNINLELGEIALNLDTSNLTINGAGVTVNGAPTASAANRIFNFNIGGGDPTITINGLTIANGNLSAGAGAGILVNNDPLVLNGVTLTGNRVTGTGAAIGVAATGANLTLINTKATFNRATSTGGVINTVTGTAATVTMTNCHFESNSASTGSVINGVGTVTLNVTESRFLSNTATGTGGAILLTAAGSSIDVDRSTFSYNQSGGGSAIAVTVSIPIFVQNSTFDNNYVSAGNSGGAIRFGTTAAIVPGGYVIRQCTFVNNVSGFNGGALGFTGLNGIALVQNCTFVDNLALSTGNGGAIGVNASGTGVLQLESCLFSGNKAAGTNTGRAPDIFFTTGTTNAVDSLISSTVGITTFNPSGTTAGLVGQAAKISSLAYFGGPTQTVTLLAGSPAINAGSNPAGLTTDQRGAGFVRDNPPADPTDIGATEGVFIRPYASSVTLPSVPRVNAKYIATVVYSDDTGIDTNSIGVADVRLTGRGYSSPQAPNSATIIIGGMGSKSVTVQYEFNPPGGSWTSAANDIYTLQLQTGEILDTSANASVGSIIGTFRVNIGQTFVVNQAADGDDMDPTNGITTLREAVRMANNNGNSSAVDIIAFDAALNGTTITVNTGELSVSDPIYLAGNGVANTIISGGLTNRIFNLGHVGQRSFIDAVHLTEGSVTGALGGGAIIMNTSWLTINNSKFSGNASGTGASNGGAINAGATVLDIFNSEFTGNTSGTTGGGAIGGTVPRINITRTTIDGNTTGGQGAAVYLSDRGMVNIIDSTVSNNTSSAATGGAIATTTAVITITNSTISGNSSANASAIGGGVRATANAIVILNNSTVTDNTAGGGGAGLGFTFTAVPGALLISNSSIVAKNNHATHPDLFTSATTISMNTTWNNSLLGASTDGDITVNNNSSLIGPDLSMAIDPMLTALSNLGGPTRTHGLMPGSPAINTGSNGLGLTYDQRGPGFPREVGLPDIGAFEFSAIVVPPPQVAKIEVNNNNAQRSLVTTIKVFFDSAVTISSGAFVLNRIANGSAGTIGLVATPMGNDVILTFDNTGSIALDPGGSLPDGTYELTIVADNVTGAGGKLDGNKNGISEGSPIDNVTSKLHRLFGDADGNGSVTAVDFNAFRLDYGSPGPSIFDFDNMGGVTASDFNAFRLRYGLTGYQP